MSRTRRHHRSLPPDRYRVGSDITLYLYLCPSISPLSPFLPLVFTLVRNAPSSRIYVQIRAYGYVHVSFVFAFLYLQPYFVLSGLESESLSKIISVSPFSQFPAFITFSLFLDSFQILSWNILLGYVILIRCNQIANIFSVERNVKEVELLFSFLNFDEYIYKIEEFQGKSYSENWF